MPTTVLPYPPPLYARAIRDYTLLPMLGASAFALNLMSPRYFARFFERWPRG